MDDNQVAMIPYFLHEGDMARQERTRKRKIGKGYKKCPRCGGDGVVRKK